MTKRELSKQGKKEVLWLYVWENKKRFAIRIIIITILITNLVKFG